ncbi:MAG TPA: hypothetical protein VFQ65_16875, partial [Kofleriaceae bacterium]|nr:hypothetical protein [Kofleriaceae bacterium]
MTTRLVFALAALVVLIATAHADDSGRTLAGSVQLDYLAVPTDPHARETTLDGATVELSLKLTKDFTKTTSASVKVCYACHGFEVGMAYVELRAADELRLRVGRMTPAFGSFPLRHDPANHMTSDKPLPYDMGRMIHRLEWNEGILPAPWVDNGAELGGTHFWDGGRVDYAAYAVSGPKGDADAPDFNFVSSRSPSEYYVDNNSQPAVGARISTALDFADDVVLELGASGMAGHYDPDRKLGFAVGGVDAVLQLGTAVLRAEYLLRATQVALGTDPATRFKYGPGPDGQYADYFTKDGFYAEGEVPVGSVSLIARWDGLRRRGNVLATSQLSSNASVYRYTAALAYRLISGIRVKTSVEYYQFSDFAD